MPFQLFGIMGGGSSIEGDGVALEQSTKLGITGSVETPHEFDLTITSSPSYNRYPLEFLKFLIGIEDVVSTICAFDNGDEADFEAPDEMVIFDGTMRLSTIDNSNFTEIGALGTGMLFETLIPAEKFSSITSLVVTAS